MSLIRIQSLSPELASTSQTLKRRRRSPSLAGQEPPGSLNPDSNSIILQLATLLSTRQSAAPSRLLLTPRRPLRRTAGRVDVVATFSMTAFIVILFCGTFSYVLSVALINSRSQCVLAADSRLLTYILLIASMGLGAVLSPIALVAFSADFRKAFVNTGRRAARYFRRSE